MDNRQTYGTYESIPDDIKFGFAGGASSAITISSKHPLPLCSVRLSPPYPIGRTSKFLSMLCKTF